MIGAVFDVRGAEAARLRLLQLGSAAPTHESASAGGTAIGAWRGAPPGRADTARGVAWIGRLDGALDELDAARAVNLRGDFAVVAARRDGVLLARGRFGGRPLYYAHENDGRTVVVCSHLAPLVAIGTRERALDADRLAAMVLVSGSGDASSTPYVGISRVRSCEAIVLSREGISERAESHVRAEIVPEGAHPEDLARALRAQIDRAVARAVGDARRVAVITGGGVDSGALLAAVVAHARGASGKEVLAIALDFGGPGDDRPYLRELAEALGIVPIRLAPRDAAGRIRDGMVLDAAPSTWPTTSWNIRQLEIAREHGADVALTGGGGDEVFDGDLRVFAERARSGAWLRASLAAARLREPGERTPLGRVRDLVVRRVASDLLPAWLRKAHGRRAADAPAWSGSRLRAFVEREHVATRSRRSTDGAARFDAFAHDPHLANASDMRGQLETASGCVRVEPYLDDDLVEFVAGLPPSLLFHDDRMRGLFRLAMRGLVPERLRLRRDKASCIAALREALDASGGLASLAELATMRALGDLGLVEPAKFSARFDDFVRAPMLGGIWMEIWPALAVEAFARR